MTQMLSHTKKHPMLLLALILCISLPISADDQNNLFDLSLEDLLNMKVSVSSKRDEDLGNVPGNVTVYSANDLNRLGYYTLEELANITPGYSTQSVLGNTVFETRGKVDNLNSKHLLLLDGIPINHARDYMAFSQYQLPLRSAEKIEFLRGPASSLYGVSAFNGVISIKTKEAEIGVDETESSFSIGSQNQKMFHGHTSKKSTRSSFRMTTGYYQKEASLAEIPVNNPSRNVYRNQQKSIFFNSRYSLNTGAAKGTSFGVIYMNKESGYGESWTGGIDTSELNNEKREIFIPYIKYENTVRNNLKLNSYVKYNESTEAGTQSNNVWPLLFNFNAVTKNIEYLLEADWTISERSSAILGANLDIRRQDNGESYIFSDTDSSVETKPFFNSKSTTSSIYTQYSHDLTDLVSGLSLTLGARYDEGALEDNKYTQVSPRLSIVQHFSNHWYAKLLYGSALKSPGVKEVGHNFEKSNDLVDPNSVSRILPETTGISELTLLYLSANFFTSLTYFETKTENPVFEMELDSSLLIDPNSGSSIFTNADNTITSTGFEFESRYRHSDSIWFMASATFTDTGKAWQSLNINTPETKINMAIGYNPDRFLVTLISQFVDSYSSTGDTENHDGQTVFDLNTQYEISNKNSIELSIKNLFDEEYFQANNGRDGIPKDSRSYQLTFRSQL